MGLSGWALQLFFPAAGPKPLVKREMKVDVSKGCRPEKVTVCTLFFNLDTVARILDLCDSAR